LTTVLCVIFPYVRDAAPSANVAGSFAGHATKSTKLRTQKENGRFEEGLKRMGVKRVLNAGCGSSPIPEQFLTPEWHITNLDCDLAAGPEIDVIADLRTLPFLDCSFDAIWCGHTLEHVYHFDLPAVLLGFRRVLTWGGDLQIVVPDLALAAQLILEGGLHEPVYHACGYPVTPHDMVFGWQREVAKGHDPMRHRTGFTALSLKGCLEQAEFTRVRAQRVGYDLYATGLKQWQPPKTS
jgi:SAM-dependent methyltransferase